MSKAAKVFSLILAVALSLSSAILLVGPAATYGNGSLLSTVYVNSITGNDSYDGSSPVRGAGNTGPRQTIRGGRDTAAPDATIHVAAGTYNEVVWLPQNLTLRGAGAAVTFINPDYTGDPVIIISTGGQPVEVQVTISGFTIQNGSNNDFTGNGGGLLVNSGCTVYLTGCNIMNNTAEAGGGLYIDANARAFLTDCTVAGNSAAGTGGGICNETGTLHLDRCCIKGNSAVYRGGGIYNTNGQACLTNCTISANHITELDFSCGGGIYNDGNMTLLNCTLAYNYTSGTSMTVGGGFADYSTSTMTCKNNIVAYNTAGGLYDNGYSAYNQVVSLGYNLDSEDTCDFYSPGDKINTDPLLGPLQNNGGPTETHAITAASPAFKRGTGAGAPATDQRGSPRPPGSCSMGAYEPDWITRTASVNTALGTVVFSIDSGSISRVQPVSVTELPCLPAGFSFPYGYFSFSIAGLAAGQSVPVTITFPHPLPSGIAYYKCQYGLAVNCSSLMSRPDPYTIILTLTDGGTGDADKTANGVIIDPGGPAFPLATPRSSSAIMPPAGGQQPVALANIVVTRASLSAASALPGDPVTVTADISNNGGGNGASTIRAYVNGNEEASSSITLNSRCSTQVVFDISRSEPGTYHVCINNIPAGSFVVSRPVEPFVILLSSILLVLLALSGLLVLWMRQRYS